MMAEARALLVLWILAASFERVGVGGQEHGHRFQCVQFGLGQNTNPWDYGDLPWRADYPRTGVWTIGTKPMNAKWLGSLSSYMIAEFSRSLDYTRLLSSPQDSKCPWQYSGDVYWTKVEPCVDDSLVQIRIHLVKQDGRILHGWLHVEIELQDQTRDQVELVYVQMRDEKFHAIGEFVNADVVPGAKCKSSNPDLSSPNKNEFFPCGTTAPREAKTSQGLMMANELFYMEKDDLKRENRLHVQPIEKGIHFLWRMNEYWCNRHAMIQPVAWIMTKNNKAKYIPEPLTAAVRPEDQHHGEMLYRKIPNFWIHPNWFGAADVIFKRGQDGELDCSELAINDGTGELTSAAKSSWLRASSPVLLKTDTFNTLKVARAPKIEICQLNPLAAGPIPSFSGRCNPQADKTSTRHHFQHCETDPNAPEFAGLNTTQFKERDEFIQEKKEGRAKFCSLKCTVPSTKEDYDGIMSFQPLNDTVDDVKPKITVGKNDPRTRSKKFKLQVARRYHGITFSFLAFFVTPVSVFVARYFKETFMQRRCYGVHVWYWTHIGGIVATLCLGFSGHSALSQFYRVWGRATENAANLHRLLGYASYLSFGFLLVFGGFRIRAPGIGRICSITLHAVMGFAHHWLNLSAVIYSTWIPMSPSIHDCDEKGLPIGISTVFWLAAAWIVIDFIFHLILTVLHIHRDRLIGIRRSWYFPIVPLASNDQMADMAGEGLRKIFLYIYIALSLSMAVVCSTFVMRNKLPDHCQFGNSTCHSWAGCTQLALKYAEWHKQQGGTGT